MSRERARLDGYITARRLLKAAAASELCDSAKKERVRANGRFLSQRKELAIKADPLFELGEMATLNEHRFEMKYGMRRTFRKGDDKIDILHSGVTCVGGERCHAGPQISKKILHGRCAIP
jgi:hypothetical protein